MSMKFNKETGAVPFITDGAAEELSKKITKSDFFSLLFETYFTNCNFENVIYMIL